MKLCQRWNRKICLSCQGTSIQICPPFLPSFFNPSIRLSVHPFTFIYDETLVYMPSIVVGAEKQRSQLDKVFLLWGLDSSHQLPCIWCCRIIADWNTVLHERIHPSNSLYISWCPLENIWEDKKDYLIPTSSTQGNFPICLLNFLADWGFIVQE